MACYHPILAIEVGKNENGKKILKFLKSDLSQDFYSKKSYIFDMYQKNILRLACGKCIGCRLDYMRNWAIRLLHEKEYSSSSYFVTLTYDDLNVKFNSSSGNLTLKKEDLQKFFKRLRKNYCFANSEKIRYFASGEYGEKTGRPHYHCIIFNLQLQDLEKLYIDDKGFIHYKSQFIEKCWPFGISEVTETSYDTMSYVASYCLKKQKGKSSKKYFDLGIEPEFCIMSRKPGIGYQWYLDNKDKIYKYDSMLVHTSKYESFYKTPLKFYDYLFEKDNSFEMQIIKERRKDFALHSESMTNKNYNDLVAHELSYIAKNNLKGGKKI